MTLFEQQHQFSMNVGRLLTWINTQPGYRVSVREWWRPPEMAAQYAKRGIGIKDSLHCVGLAVDLVLMDNGAVQTDSAAYARLGRYWKSLSPQNRWGGDFHDAAGRPKPDGGHFEQRPL